MSGTFSISPLQAVTNEDLQILSGCLWKWNLCGTCSKKPYCTKSSCPWGRKAAISPILHRYERLTSCYLPEYFAPQHALTCHRDLFNIMRLIRNCPSETKEQLMRRAFESDEYQTAKIPALADQERALNLAASVLLSLNCGIPDDCADQLEDCNSSLPWTLGVSIDKFVAEAFGKTPTSTEQERNLSVDSNWLREITAKRLKQKAGLLLKATDDLHSHLRLDQKSRVVYIFDCTAVLEELLLASMDEPDWCLLPRGLLLEVLYTIYKLLFPPGRESQIVLSSLVRKGGFDKDMLRYTIERFRRDDDREIDYSYFGERLIELHNELKDPSPRNWFERLFEGGTKSAERKMLMATTIGVFIAVTIGMVGLVVAGFQAWVGYQQWKHPVKDQ